MSRTEIETNADTLLPIMERDYKARIHALEQRCERLKEAGDKLCEAKNARILELEADLALAGKIHAVALDLLRRVEKRRDEHIRKEIRFYLDYGIGSPSRDPNLSIGSALSDEGKP